MTDSRLDRARAWLVTGPLGRGFAFALDFGAALRTMFARRRAARRADGGRARN